MSGSKDLLGEWFLTAISQTQWVTENGEENLYQVY